MLENAPLPIDVVNPELVYAESDVTVGYESMARDLYAFIRLPETVNPDSVARESPLFTILFFTWALVKLPLYPIISEASAATCGVAMEVPS